MPLPPKGPHPLTDADRKIKETEETIAKRRRKPEYWVEHLRKELKDRFEIAEAATATFDAGDLFSLPKLTLRGTPPGVSLRAFFCAGWFACEADDAYTSPVPAGLEEVGSSERAFSGNDAGMFFSPCLL